MCLVENIEFCPGKTTKLGFIVAKTDIGKSATVKCPESDKMFDNGKHMTTVEVECLSTRSFNLTQLNKKCGMFF